MEALDLGIRDLQLAIGTGVARFAPTLQKSPATFPTGNKGLLVPFVFANLAC